MMQVFLLYVSKNCGIVQHVRVFDHFFERLTMKQVKTTMLYDSTRVQLPQTMMQVSQWVNWRYETRKGQRTKVPYSPHTLMRASSTDARTWSTYAHALTRVSNKTGLGFVLTPPSIGIDLDHCVQEDGGMTLLAHEVIAKFPMTYAEYSPSGTGVHLFVTGILLQALKTSLGELYTTGRFFTVTGCPLPHVLHAVVSQEHGETQVSFASEEDIAWLVGKLTPARHNRAGTDVQRGVQVALHTYGNPLRKGTSLYAALDAMHVLWAPTWDCARPLDGSKGDQSDSAREMSLARMAVSAGVEDQDVYGLLVGWRLDQRLPPKHHRALELTIEKAHEDYVDEEQEKVLDAPDTLTPLDLAMHLGKMLKMPIVRLVQMGREPSTYRVHLAHGVIVNLGGYAQAFTQARWQQLVFEHQHVSLVVDKKRWKKIVTLLKTFCTYEDGADTSEIAELHGWVDGYFSDTVQAFADVETLHRNAPFQDATHRHLQLDEFCNHVRIHTGVKTSRISVAGRLRAQGWLAETVTRSDAKRRVTRNYWTKAHGSATGDASVSQANSREMKIPVDICVDM